MCGWEAVGNTKFHQCFIIVSSSLTKHISASKLNWNYYRCPWLFQLQLHCFMYRKKVNHIAHPTKHSNWPQTAWFTVLTRGCFKYQHLGTNDTCMKIVNTTKHFKTKQSNHSETSWHASLLCIQTWNNIIWLPPLQQLSPQTTSSVLFFFFNDKFWTQNLMYFTHISC